MKSLKNIISYNFVIILQGWKYIMKIIFVTDLELWSMGTGKGGEAFTRTIKKYLSQKDDIYLISDVPENRNDHLIDREHNIIINPSKFKRWICIRKAGLIFRILDHLVMTHRFKKEIETLILKKTGGDFIIYAYEVFGVKACRTIAKKYRIPMVTRFQGTKMIGYRYTRLNRLLRYPHYQALETEADLVIMTDDGTKGSEILDLVGNKSSRMFLKNGLDLMDKEIWKKVHTLDREKFRNDLGIKCDDMIFLTVSRLTGWKRVDRAIRGFSDFRKLGGNGKLIIVGDGDCREQLEQLTSYLGVDRDVMFVGAIKHEKVYEFMISSDIFLSLFDLSNVGNPLLEAMTLQKCIITLDIGDTGKLINEYTGVLLSEEQIKELGSVMLELSQDEQRRKYYGENAGEYAKANFMTWRQRMDLEYAAVSELINMNIG